MYKKRIYSSVTIALIIIILVVAVVPVLAAKSTGVNTFKVAFGEPITVYKGRGGISFPTPQFSGVVGMSAFDANAAGGPAGVRFISSFDFAITPTKGTSVTFANYQATVFFNLIKGWEVRAWNNKQLAIYHAEVGGWKKLPTYAVTGARLAATAAGTGVYALGMEEPQIHAAP